MLNRKTHRKSTVAIKRVITQGNVFICGICRKNFRDISQANTCLTRCLGGHLNPSEPVVALSEAGAKKFRCHFCRWVYSERNKAVECAGACKAKTSEVIAFEHPVDINPGRVRSQTTPSQGTKIAFGHQAPVKAPKKPTQDRRDQMHKFSRDGRKLFCRKCGSEKKTLDEVISCYDSHPEKIKKTADEKKVAAEKKEKSGLISVKTDTLETERTTKSPRLTNEDEKFHRDGARYVCRHCGKKSFTREEVFACYDGHAGEPPVAKVVLAKTSDTEAVLAPEKTAKLSDVDDDHKFFRDGARYICRNCQKKHFTRGDVLNHGKMLPKVE